MISYKSLLKFLDETNIDYSIYSHPPLFTVNDSIKFRGNIEGAHTKNLFLKDKKKNFYLFSCLENTIIDLKFLRKRMNLNNLSFAGEKYLSELLNVKPGAVSPFGLLNDIEKKINFFLDLKLDRLNSFNFHPLDNTATINIKRGDFYKLFKINNITINLFNFETYTTCDIKQT